MTHTSRLPFLLSILTAAVLFCATFAVAQSTAPTSSERAEMIADQRIKARSQYDAERSKTLAEGDREGHV